MTDIGDREERLRVACQAPGAEVGQCPYVLIGPAGRMRQKLADRQARPGLSAVIVPDGAALEQFMNAVINA